MKYHFVLKKLHSISLFFHRRFLLGVSLTIVDFMDIVNMYTKEEETLKKTVVVPKAVTKAVKQPLQCSFGGTFLDFCLEG